jgi:hypothetical protein
MLLTANSTADLAGAVLALGNVWPGNSPITLDLESSGSGVPGTILASLTQQGTIRPQTSQGLVAFDYFGHTLELTSGTSYWLVALQTNANTEQAWFLSNSDIGTLATNLSDSATGPWVIGSRGSITAFEVDGAPVAEPNPLWFMLSGLVILGMARMIKKRRLASRPYSTGQ